MKSQYKNKDNININGMSIIEMTFSLLLISIFMATCLSIVQLTSVILGKTNSQINGKYTTTADNYLSQGLIIDQYKLQTALDFYADSLSQPGITLSKINSIQSSQFGTLTKGCSLNPRIDWNLPVSSTPIPNEIWSPSSINYALCIKATSLTESSLSDLITNASGAKPGIYILLALPQKVSAFSLPSRRVFCRPDPYC